MSLISWRRRRPAGKGRIPTLLGWLARPRGPAWDIFVYFLLSILFYLPLIAGYATFEAGDFGDHFLPFARFLQAELAAMRWPLWNPYTYAGHPFLADIQAGVYYLPSYPFLAGGALSGHEAGQLYWLQLEAIAHIAMAGLGMHWLLWTLTGQRRAAAVAGIAFMFSGFITGYAPLQLAILRSAVWLPFAMTACWRGFRQPGRLKPWLLATVFCAFILLGGHAQTALYAVYALMGWLLVTAWHFHVEEKHTQRSPEAKFLSRNWAFRIAGVVTAAIGAIALSAGQWLPAWEFARLSVRAELDYAALSGGLPLRDTWQAALPGVFTQFSPLYIGTAALISALFAVAAALWGKAGNLSVDAGIVVATRPPVRHNGRRIAAFFAAVALLGLLASYGENARLYPLLYWGAPGWDMFRGQERAAYLVVLGTVGLAGLGVAWAPDAGRTLRKRSALLLGGLVTVVVYGFGLLYQLVGQTAIGNGLYLWIAFYTLTLGLSVSLMLWVDGWSRARSALLVLLVVANLFAANGGTNLDWIGPGQRVAMPPEVLAVRDAAHKAGAEGGEAGRVYNEFRAIENYGMRIEVEDVWGASPLRTAHYDRLFDQFPLDRMWALTGVEYVLTWRRELFLPSELLAEFPQAVDTTYLHRLPEKNPRARLVQTLEVVSDVESVERLADHSVDLDAVAFLPAESGAEPLRGAGLQEVAWSRGRVASRGIEPGRRAFEVDTPGPAFVVISENWLPGWAVKSIACGDTRNGEVGCPALPTEGAHMAVRYFEPLRVNLTLIGVAVPAGQSRFELVYRPASVRIGAAVTGITILILTSLSVYGWARQRRRRAMP